MLGLMVTSGLCAGRPAWADTVFSNYDQYNCFCGHSEAEIAEEFTPAATFDFTGAAAYFENVASGSLPTSMALYSESGGLPATLLWASASLSVAPGLTLVSTSYAGTPIELASGTAYFLAVDVPNNSDLDWEFGDLPLVPSALLVGSVWQSLGSSSLQFEVFGDPVASALPEPSSLALLGAGLAGFGATRRRFTSRR